MDKRILFIILVFTAVSALTVGCARSIVAPVESSANPVVIVDGRGTEIRLERPAERIVTIPMPSAAMLMAVDGSAEKLVGMHPASKTAYEEGILTEIYPGAGEVATGFIESGFTPNVEEVLALRPDVVFQWAGRGDDLIAPLENAGLTVVAVEYGDQEKLETLLRIKGEVLGKSEKAERLIAHHHETREAIAETAAALPARERPRVLYFLRYADQLQVAGTGTYNDFYIDLTGGTNVAADGPADFYEVTVEQILVWDPEVILLGGFDAATPADVYADDVLASVSAVQNRRVYKVPLGGYRWDPPSQESPLMWTWLAEILHPDSFDYDLRADVREFYRWVYGYDVSEEDIDAILRTPMNEGSTGYEQFDRK